MNSSTCERRIGGTQINQIQICKYLGRILIRGNRNPKKYWNSNRDLQKVTERFTKLRNLVTE